VIELAQVTKKFGSRLAVDNLALAVARGEIFGLLGHNGAGKSTAIGMMLGQVWPTCGQVMVCGYDVTRQRERALRKVGAIFETPAFYHYLSGRRNLEILSDYTAPTPAQRITEVLHWVGLAGRERSKVKTYSHGMKVRLALAQALLPDPELLILDEPGDGLDPEGIHDMRQTILRLHRELGLTILLSSHFLNEVEQICTRIAVLHRGRKIFEGPIDEVKQRHAWIRLRVDDFAEATWRMREAKLITQDRSGQLIAPAEGVGTAQIVRFLVQQGMAVHEITPEEQTLESFYLTLMETERGRETTPPRSQD
jgi:ABC-2 type transport system ATP-binding protein